MEIGGLKSKVSNISPDNARYIDDAVKSRVYQDEGQALDEAVCLLKKSVWFAECVEADGDGYQRPAVFGCSFRLDGTRNEQGH